MPSILRVETLSVYLNFKSITINLYIFLIKLLLIFLLYVKKNIYQFNI